MQPRDFTRSENKIHNFRPEEAAGSVRDIAATTTITNTKTKEMIPVMLITDKLQV